MAELRFKHRFEPQVLSTAPRKTWDQMALKSRGATARTVAGIPQQSQCSSEWRKGTREGAASVASVKMACGLMTIISKSRLTRWVAVVNVTLDTVKRIVLSKKIPNALWLNQI